MELPNLCHKLKSRNYSLSENLVHVHSVDIHVHCTDTCAVIVAHKTVKLLEGGFIDAVMQLRVQDF